MCGKVWVENKYFFGAICDGAEMNVCVCVCLELNNAKNEINAVSILNKVWVLYENKRIGWRWRRREEGRASLK